LKNNFQIISFS